MPPHVLRHARAHAECVVVLLLVKILVEFVGQDSSHVVERGALGGVGPDPIFQVVRRPRPAVGDGRHDVQRERRPRSFLVVFLLIFPQ